MTVFVENGVPSSRHGTVSGPNYTADNGSHMGHQAGVVPMASGGAPGSVPVTMPGPMHGVAPSAMHMRDNGLGSIMAHFGAMSLANAGLASAPSMHGLNTGAYVSGANGSIVFTAPYGGPIHHIVADHHAYGTAYPMQYSAAGYPAAGYPAAYAAGPVIPITPGRPMNYGDRAPRELPILDRRGSYSTSATESAPTTPYFGHVASDHTKSLERSSFTTPSPRETTTYVATATQAKLPADPELERLLMADPPIPKAVPAVWTEHTKQLDQCLQNRIQGNRNVYIRGLHPTTDDNLLIRYAERFGEVEQSKAIIDTATGACKGFGFAKFKDVKDSECCIRGFYRLGSSTESNSGSYSKESFNARLKAEGDELSTNLYISNLPKDVNEAILNHTFEPYHVISSKILRDSMGNSRGVGFARFESRDVCEKVIKTFNGSLIGADKFVMQVRYADTPAQKELKRITAERRQYRTNEYNIGAYGTHAVGMNPSIYGSSSWRRGGSGNSFGHFHNGFRSRKMGSLDTSSSGSPQPTGTSDSMSGDETTTVIEHPHGAIGSKRPLSTSTTTTTITAVSTDTDTDS